MSDVTDDMRMIVTRPSNYGDMFVERRLRTKKFFRLWSITVELVAAVCSWPISDNDAVLHTSEDVSVSPSILYLALHLRDSLGCK